MSDIAQQMTKLVNNATPAVATALAPVLRTLAAARDQREAMTPTEFARRERALVEDIIELGRTCCLEFVESQAAQTPMLQADEHCYSLLESSTRAVITPFGAGEIERSLYRRVAAHNGPTLDPVEQRCGLYRDMTPAAAELLGALVAELPSRGAHRLLTRLGIKRLSRSAIERGGQALGHRLEAHREEIETRLIERFEVPEKAVAVSVSVDRVSVPLEKPVKRGPGRPAHNAPRRPVKIEYEMAYVACWTLYDAEGEPLYSCRYGRMPTDSAALQIEEQLRFDLLGLLELRPDLRVSALSDGAPEMLQMLERVCAGIDGVVQLVDFWHAIEYVAAALAAAGRDVKRELASVKRSLLGADSGARKTLTKLRTWALAWSDGSCPEALERAITYFTNKTDAGLMNYATARAAHLPVGSGHVEATAKTLVAMRMKRSGSRWKYTSGQHVLTLRSLTTSLRWSESCQWHAASLTRSAPAIVEVA